MITGSRRRYQEGEYTYEEAISAVGEYIVFLVSIAPKPMEDTMSFTDFCGGHVVCWMTSKNPPKTGQLCEGMQTSPYSGFTCGRA